MTMRELTKEGPWHPNRGPPYNPWQKLKQWEDRIDTEEFWRRSPNAKNSDPVAGATGLLPIRINTAQTWTIRDAPATPGRAYTGSAPSSSRAHYRAATALSCAASDALSVGSLRCPTSAPSVASSSLRGEIEQERRKRQEAENEVLRLQMMLDEQGCGLSVASSRGFQSRGCGPSRALSSRRASSMKSAR